MIEQDIHARLCEGACQQANITSREIGIIYRGDFIVVNVEAQCAAHAVGAQVVDRVLLNEVRLLHRDCSQQQRLPADKFSDGVIAIVADDKEIIITALIAAHQSGAILSGTVQAERVHFDSYIAKILFRRGPQVEIGLLHEHPIPAAVIVHDAVFVGNTVPAGGVVLEFILVENFARVGSWDHGSLRCRTGGENEREK